MLNVPSVIQDLYKADGIWKNFRAEFVDGSAAPITNQDIVRESLKFEESCCSESVFRFGGCERSKIEFETVGIGNILGQLLRCSIEIDVSSLTGAQLATIVADPGDGVLVAPAQSDIGRGYYRIPLGVFRVSSCPRNHQATAHRQITALSPRYWRLSPIEEAKLNWFSGGRTFTLDPEKFMLANVGYWGPGFMESRGWTKSLYASWNNIDFPQTSFSDQGVFYRPDGTAYTIKTSGTYGKFTFNAAHQGLFCIHLGDIDAAGLNEFYQGWFSDVDWEQTDAGPDIDPVRSADDMIKYAMFPACCALTHRDITASTAPPVLCQRAVLNADAPVFLTDAVPMDQEAPSSALAGAVIWELQILANVTVEIYDSGGALVDSFSSALDADMPALYKWTNSDTDSLPTLALTVPEADKITWADSSNTYTFRRWNIDAEKIIRGWAELNGAELLTGRGVPKLVRLNQLSPAAIAPGNYSSVWWEEYLTEPVGSVSYVFGKANDQAGAMSLGSGGSVYDLTDNGVLALAPAAGREEIEDVIRYRMADGLSELDSYSPAEIEMPAWPWLEAGDALEITAADDETVNTYIMQRTISGVQLLWDEIDAPGGEVESDED